LLRASWQCRQQVREEVTRKLTTSRGSYEELVTVEFGLNPVAVQDSLGWGTTEVAAAARERLAVIHQLHKFNKIWS